MFRKLAKIIMLIVGVLSLVILYTCTKNNPTDSSIKIPTLITDSVSEITQTTARCGGIVLTDSGLAVTSRGICWSADSIPTIADSRSLGGSGTGSFAGLIIGLSANTSYYVRAFATNSAGTGYGNISTFTTLPYPVPQLTTSEVIEITRTTARSGGTVSSDSGAPVTRRGVCWSTNPYPNIYDNNTSDGEGVGSFTSVITGLEGGTSYNVRAYAINTTGVGYGNVVNFRTLQVPTLTTTAISAVTETTATSGGFIYLDGGAAVFARGVCWNTDSIPTVADSRTIDGFGVGGYISNISNLNPGTSYYLRAYATNSAGTGYGGLISFTTADSMGIMTDIDGNIYITVKIGTQWWMAENLKVTHYRNGIAIPNVTDSASWNTLNSGAYCDYDNNPANSATYGKLYNWYALNHSGNVAPAGWHVPSDADWRVLSDFLGDITVAGGKLKETGTTHWSSPNTGATNETRFSALPAGARFDYGSFGDMHISASFWCITQNPDVGAFYRSLNYNTAELFRDSRPLRDGISVRCVKD